MKNDGSAAFDSGFIANSDVYKEFSPNGIIKISNEKEDRISDYKSCLNNACGDVFIYGTSMIHLAEDSSHILLNKAETSKIRLLLLDPDWIQKNHNLLSFLEDEEDRKEFHLEIRNSLRKLKSVIRRLPDEHKDHIKIKTYNTIFPYIITGCGWLLKPA